MMTGVLFLIKALAAGLVVGFVTASVRSWVDRVFLVIMLVGVVGIPIDRAVTINLIVVALAGVLMAFRQRECIKTMGGEWVLIVLPAILGAVGGRLLGLQAAPAVLIGALGGYAILAGMGIVLIRLVPERENQSWRGWLVPISFLAGTLTGFISTGGKPFKVAVYNNAMGHHTHRAYAFASLGIAVAAWSALGTQLVSGHSILPADLLVSAGEFVIVTLTALGVNKIWTPKLNTIVNLIVAPILLVVGIRFVIMALSGL
jgi:uncharacterized membrane protein YfcA